MKVIKTEYRDSTVYRRAGKSYYFLVVYRDGLKMWFDETTGARYRRDGPAVIYPSGVKSWSFGSSDFMSQKEWLGELLLEALG